MSLADLGPWAVFAYRLGVEARRFPIGSERLVSFISVPSRDLFIPIMAIGSILCDGYLFNGQEEMSWDYFLNNIADDTPVYFSYGKKQVKAKLGSVENGARIAIETTRSGEKKHFLFKRHLDNKEVKFESPSRYPLSPEGVNFFQDLGIEHYQEWYEAMYPLISINSVKHRFISNIQKLSIQTLNGGLSFSEILKPTETGKLGSGRSLLLSETTTKALEKSSKVVIIGTRRLEKVMREYSSSDLFIVLENAEYDSAIAGISRRVRELAKPLPPDQKFMNSPPTGVKISTFLAQRST